MSNIKRLSRLDLNLLTVFHVISNLRHVTKAAHQLGVSQPALSHALARLREALGDPLFVKSSRGMVLTPYAETIAGPIADCLVRLEQEVLTRSAFVPSDLQRQFRIKSTDLIESLVMGPLLEALAAKAPDVQVSFTSSGFDLPKKALESGETDIAIAGFFGELPDGFYQQRLLSDGFLCAVRRDHPRLRDQKRLTLDEFCAERHILISPGGELSGPVDQALKKLKRRRSIACGTSGFTVAGWIAARSDYLLTAPSRLVGQLAHALPLKTFPPPLSLPKIRIVQVWHQRHHHDAAHRWFREILCSLMTNDGTRTNEPTQSRNNN